MPAQALHRKMLNRELRAEFIAGAEEQSNREKGRSLSKAEFQNVLARYPGDLPQTQRPTAQSCLTPSATALWPEASG